MSPGKIGTSLAEQVESTLEARQDRLRRKQPDPGRGELEGERQTVQSHADLRDRRRVVLAEREAGASCPGALDEEGDAGNTFQGFGRLPRVG